ncbi:hypothetical protein KJS94_13055 [Flavihumibacter rivuli]|uniref:multiheme c-type cytochrome n=1 Tax=Flavihumibacter rivuli TaxID=2838156 RepID=UPI001BDE19FF|nr:multiheme c-type cytochrome [Flavihumibacter rivuli]ULQ55574.1 hypothetical protein KJS94_13055 [Flavihumibacter rivuli]
MRTGISILLISLIGIGVLVVQQCSPGGQPKELTAAVNEYVGSPTCQTCHQQEHQQWLGSHHFKAMQPANDSTVLGDFNNASLEADGVRSRFFRKDGKYFIHTEGEDGKYQDFEIRYTFGYAPLQQYLVEFPSGRMQVTRASWDTKKEKWFHQYAGQRFPAGDWLHWTGNGQNWNTMCSGCHSTNLKKGYDPEKDSYQTTFNEENVSCESCHGPGKLHIDYVSGEDFKKGKRTNGSLLALTAGSRQTLQVNNCGNCHGRRSEITGNPIAGKEYLDDFIPELPTTEYFHADGQMDDEDFNYASFLQSKMFNHGVTCTNCHNPHSGALKFDGSKVCSQCHSPQQYNTQAHSFHAPSIQSVNCVSCHMPAKTYMGNDLRHDHSFRIPRPDLSAQYGTPNTCNSCHQDSSPSWAAEKIAQHYGPKRKYHFSEDLIPGSRMDAASEAHLTKLLGDTACPDIIRATALEYLAALPSANIAGILREYLDDSVAMVRFRALKGLANHPPSEWVGTAAPLLKDKVRAVRIAAAELFCGVSTNDIPSGYYEAYNAAKNEWQQMVLYQTDFAQGNAQAGDFYRRFNDLLMAEKFYRRAIQKDNQLSYARVNLASLLNQNGKNEEALQQLLAAQQTEPRSDHIAYSLALLYSEMNQPDLAEKCFRKAVDLKSRNSRLYYNYALFQQQRKKLHEAEELFKLGLSFDPANTDILYALSVFYLQQGNRAGATEKARQLKRLDPANPNYQALFQQLSL